MLVGLATHEIEIPPLQPPRQLAHLPAADLVPVDAEDRLDLVARAAQERFLGVVDLGAVDIAFLGLLAGQLLQQVDQRGPRVLSKIELVTAGVTGRPLRIMKKQAPCDSAMWPCWVSSSTLS